MDTKTAANRIGSETDRLRHTGTEGRIRFALQIVGKFEGPPAWCPADPRSRRQEGCHRGDAAYYKRTSPSVDGSRSSCFKIQLNCLKFLPCDLYARAAYCSE